VFCVLCFVFCVLCFVFCVLCFVFCVLCFVFCVFFCLYFRYNHQVNEALQLALADYESLAFTSYDPRIKRTEGTVRIKSTGSIIKVTKGAPHIIQSLDKDEKKGHMIHEKVAELSTRGIRAVAIAVSEPINSQWVEGSEEQHISPVWHLTGMLTVLDPPRDDTKSAIAKSQAYGVPVRMVTGDHIQFAKIMCKELEMGDMTRPEWPHIEGPDHLPVLNSEGHPPKDLVCNPLDIISCVLLFIHYRSNHTELASKMRMVSRKCSLSTSTLSSRPTNG
jgi:magnesium-transporting ATPase (P-type)